MRLARKLGTITYRSAAEWSQRFGRAPVDPHFRTNDPFGPAFAVEGYLEAQAQRFLRVFDANCYLYLSRAMDRFDLATHGESVEALMRRARLDSALVIGVESDLLFPLAEQAALAAALDAAGVHTRFVPLPSIEGHDAFLVDLPRFSAAIGEFLARL